MNGWPISMSISSRDHRQRVHFIPNLLLSACLSISPGERHLPVLHATQRIGASHRRCGACGHVNDPECSFPVTAQRRRTPLRVDGVPLDGGQETSKGLELSGECVLIVCVVVAVVVGPVIGHGVFLCSSPSPPGILICEFHLDPHHSSHRRSCCCSSTNHHHQTSRRCISATHGDDIMFTRRMSSFYESLSSLVPPCPVLVTCGFVRQPVNDTN